MNSQPMVSVIVPARNEEACLGRCLESLVAQTGIDFEIIVVDDASTDRTAEIAKRFSPPVTVISAPPLATDWTGKNNAMSAGASVAKGNWLLFTDADTVHKAGSLAGAVAEAEGRGVALLSYSPEQEVRTFWEKVVMPVIFAELASTFPPKKVNDAASPVAAANGQYLLMSRAAYDAVGGHTKIASDLLEDVAMAWLVKSSGHKIFFRYGGDAVSTRMYRNWGQMKEGWTKNLAVLFPRAGGLALMRIGEFTLPLLGLGAVLAGTMSFGNAMWWTSKRRLAVCITAVGLFAIVVPLTTFVRRIRRAHFRWSNTAISYFGLPAFAYLLLRSACAYKRSRVEWKGRRYVHTHEG